MHHTERQAEYGAVIPFALISVVRDVARRWYCILFAALLAGVVAYGISNACYTPIYTAEGTFVVSAGEGSSTSYENLSAAANLAKVFAEVLNSSVLHDHLAEQPEMAAFDGAVEAAAIPETNLLTLRATASDPHAAVLAIGAVAEHHSEVSRQLLGNTVLEVLRPPQESAVPSNPRRAGTHAGLAALISGAAVCVLLTVLSCSRDTVRSRTEGERKLDARCLGELAHERGRKTPSAFAHRPERGVLITGTDASPRFVESVRKLRCRVEQQMGGGKKVLLVTSVGKGEGKSTVAVNLALALAKKRHRVLLMECDLRQPACYKLLEQPGEGMGTADVITGHCTLGEALTRETDTGLYLLLERKHSRNATDLVGGKGMERLLDQCRAEFDYVILDLPPVSVVPDAESVLELADAALLVVGQNAATAPQINRAAGVLDGSRSGLLGYVLNDVRSFPLSARGGCWCGYGLGHGKYGKRGGYETCRANKPNIGLFSRHYDK